MEKKKVVVALGHKALGTTLPEQKVAVKSAAKAIADLVEEGCQVAISHSNAPQVGMIHTALNEFGKEHEDYTFAPMSVCSAMSQGYIGYDLQNAIREELLGRGIPKTVSTIITQVVVDPYDDAFAEPIKVIGRYMTREEWHALTRQRSGKGNLRYSRLVATRISKAKYLRHSLLKWWRYFYYDGDCRTENCTRLQKSFLNFLHSSHALR